jgi:hypothetical protein
MYSTVFLLLKKTKEPCASAYNPSFLGGRDQEDHSSRPAWANSSGDPISKITRPKWTGGVVQVVVLLCKHKTLSSNLSPSKQKKDRQVRCLRQHGKSRNCCRWDLRSHGLPGGKWRRRCLEKWIGQRSSRALKTEQIRKNQRLEPN